MSATMGQASRKDDYLLGKQILILSATIWRLRSPSKCQIDDCDIGRNISARIRLNQQHFLYPKFFGYLLHPDIPVTENLKIADVGTGSGIWLFDLHSSLPPSTTLVGLDVDLSQTPPKPWLPPNIRFDNLDVNSDDPLPPEYVEAFDIINVRLFLLVVKDNDPSSVLQRLLTMLRPGGWLQWTEADNSTVYTDFISATTDLDSPVSEQRSGAAMKSLHQSIIPDDLRYRPTWPLQLPKYFKATGFEAVESDVKESKDFLPWLAFSNDIVTPVYGEIIQNMPLGEKRLEMERLYEEAVQESWSGTAWNAPRINVIGQKRLHKQS